MTKMRRLLPAVALVALWGVPSQAQTADEIIEKHLAASGGRAAMGKLTSRVGTGSIIIGTPVARSIRRLPTSHAHWSSWT
jgi:hypothetical protein